jgi:tRNA 2-thiouridine synthesizing protein E
VALKRLGEDIALTDEGFLCNLLDWSPGIAYVLAENNGIQMSDAHWEIVDYARNYYLTYKHLPNTRVFIKGVKKTFGPDKGNSLYLHRLFPEGPLRYACKLAGLPKPPTCL